ncbi:hypothetical protein HY251_08310 [bacterium]|nr:hypothetical protein [bacterium]
MRLSHAVLSTAVALSLLAHARAQDTPAKPEKPPEKKDEKPKDGDKKDEKPKEEKKDPFPKPPEDLAKILARFDKDDEPSRELKRCYVSALYYHLERDVDRFILFFHDSFERNDGGVLKKVPPADLKAQVKNTYAATPKTGLKLDQLIDLAKLRVYSKAQAKEADDGWKKKPSDIASVMADGDYLAIAPVIVVDRNKDEGNADVFYVLRKQDGVWKIAVGE